MRLKASFCDPLKHDVIDLGIVHSDELIDKFKTIDWSSYLQSMVGKKENEIFFSPSFEVQNIENANGVAISAIEANNKEIVFYVFFKRPKKVKTLMGLREVKKPDYVTEILNQSEADVLLYLHALQRNDLAFLEEKIK